MFTGLASPTHLLILIVIVLLLFGAKKLPELGRSLGHGIQEFKEGLNAKEEPEKAEGEALEEGRKEKNEKELAPDGAPHEEEPRAQAETAPAQPKT
jgi:sec-independent protein translocase protein TatA